MTEPSRRLLLVEDNLANRMTLEAILEQLYVVDAVASFPEARGLLQSDAHYDVVLLDNHVLGETASEFLPSVRALAPAAKVLLVSGVVPDPFPPVDGMFQKGSNVDELLELLSSMLGR